ncbi:MAG: UDP-N-acetylmuramoyl-L-alanine--D-glutamate ligase [Phycisphaerales bacterium]|nr:UDP-N-acetylmuramoyl-L-alanine--D-glutamate ligase [Phycisphaerales bacterium]
MNVTNEFTIRGTRCLVMGLGAFGGGIGATQWLAQQGAKEILVTDLSSAEKLKDSLAKIAPLIQSGMVRLRLGAHELADFQQAQLVVANPAVPKPWTNPYLNAAREAGAHITTELRFALQHIPSRRVIAVTGSSGKSTTSALIHHALDGFNGNRAHFAGNIGGSLLQNCPQIGPNEWLVLELSSFMLWWLGPDSGNAHWHARVGVLTNLCDNHLDWHGGAAHYSASKSVIRNQSADDQIFLSRFDIESPEQAAVWSALPAGQWWKNSACHGTSAPPNPRLGAHDALQKYFQSDADYVQQCMPHFESAKLIGEHNKRNALLALHACMAALRIDNPQLDVATTARALAAKMNLFTGLPHRLSLAHEFNGVRWIDDSKATTPPATLFAVKSFSDTKKIHLIAGGVSKGADLSSIMALTPRLAGLYCIGTSAQELANAGGIYCETLENAMQIIRAKLRHGDVVLLSPGCASTDQFQNYEARGNRFAQLATECDQIAKVSKV